MTHLVVRLWISPTVNIDEAREAVLGQTLEWGYQPRQPPLYNWLVWGAFQAFGVGVFSLALVKYGVLAAAYWFAYASARQLLADPRLATLAAFSLLLVFPISWVLHEDLTHSVAVLAACAATFYTLLRVEASGAFVAYLAFGTALGLGALSKFTYSLFAAALLLAALTLEPFRARLLHRRALLAFALAALLVLPYAIWFVRHEYELVPILSEELKARTGHTYLDWVMAGLAYIVRVTLYYVTPLWLVFLVVFPGVYRRRLTSPEELRAPGRLLPRFFLCVLALLVAGALTKAIAYLKFRWMIPAFFLLPLYGFWRLDKTAYEDRAVRRFAAVLLATALAILGGIAFRVYTGTLFGDVYRLNAPYDVAAARLADAGFVKGTIVAGSGPLGGNLRLRFPRSRVISLENPSYIPPTPGDGQCLIAWERGGGSAVPPDVSALLASILEVALTGEEPIRVVEARYRFTEEEVRRVYYVLLGAGAGRCR